MIKVIQIKKFFVLLILTTTVLFSILYLNEIKIYFNENLDLQLLRGVVKRNSTLKYGLPKSNAIKIAVTSCGNDIILEQTLNMIKSAIIFSKSKLHFIIVVDNNAELYEEMVNNILKFICI
jgi:hypothetical protein